MRRANCRGGFSACLTLKLEALAPKARMWAGCAEGARCGAEGARWVGLLDLCSLLVGMVCGDCLLAENFLKGAFGGAFGARPSASSWPLVSHCPCKFPQPGAVVFCFEAGTDCPRIHWSPASRARGACGLD